MNRTRVLDWKSLHFDVLEANRWLSLGRDLWKEIFILVSHDQRKDRSSVGKVNFLPLWRLRATCRLFSNLIDPKFCLKVLYENPFTNTCKFKCVDCSTGVCTKWFCDRFRRSNNLNPFYGGEDTYKTKRYYWVHNPEHGTLDRQRRNIVRCLEPSGPSTTQTHQRHQIEVVEQT
jgi:hypothetical protein